MYNQITQKSHSILRVPVSGGKYLIVLKAINMHLYTVRHEGSWHLVPPTPDFEDPQGLKCSQEMWKVNHFNTIDLTDLKIALEKSWCIQEKKQQIL